MHAPAAKAKSTRPRRLRWTVDDYFRLYEQGFLDGRRVELIDGEIIRMPAQGRDHMVCITKLNELLVHHFPTTTHWVAPQGTLKLDKYNAPDPDFHVRDVPVGTPDAQLPKPFIVIEVSDTTYAKDAGPKLRLYARSGMQEYWIVNVQARCLEVYRKPQNTTGRRSGWCYADIHILKPAESVTMLARPGITWTVSSMLP